MTGWSLGSVAERRARLARRHLLAAPARAGTAAEVAAALIALHGTDPASVYLAAWARSAAGHRAIGFAAIERALYEDRELVRMLGMRRTMFVVPAGLAPVIQVACTDQVAARMRSGLVRDLAAGGVAPDAGRWLDEVGDATVKALVARGSATNATKLRDLRSSQGRSPAGESDNRTGPLVDRCDPSRSSRPPEVPLRSQSATTTITRAVTVAAGVFAPGHLGELTQYLPFELVDDVLEQAKTVQRRLRDLPSRAGVYFVLALGMYPRLGYARVWGKLTAGLAGLLVPRPSEKALRDLRRRLGPAPLKALFEVVTGPLAQPGTAGVCFGGLRTVAFDGLNSLKVPGTGRNRFWIGKIRYRQGFAGYPTLRLMALAETGTRALLGATVGCAANRDEASLARQLLHLLRPGMLLLLDRAFDASAFLREAAATGAMLLARATSTRHPPVLEHLPDGSYLSDLDGLQVRIIEADLTVTGSDGSRIRDTYRLITTLTSYRRYPAASLARLCHERWEIESAYFALRHTLLTGHVLRSGDRPGLEQEVWALLTVCQLLRMAMVTAVETRPGTDPDRASFTTALETARDQLTAAAGICPDGPPDLTGAIGRAVLDTLLPPRRPRYSARNVKCTTSRYHARDDGRPALPATITAIDITICTPPLDLRPGRTRRDRTTPRPPQPPTRRQRITAIMNTGPCRDWAGSELAKQLQVKPRNMLTQLAEWARLGFLARTGQGTYALNTPAADTSLTPEPDP